MSDQELESNVTNYGASSILDDVAAFPLEEAINEEVAYGCLEKGQPSGMKRKGDHDPMETIGVEKDGVKEDYHEQSKQQKRTRSAEMHNHNERLRRQRLKEKIKALQELIPNCSKRDKSSTFDDAIKYIKTLQYQVQVMSMGAGYSTLNSPQPHPHPRQQGMQIPNSAPFLTTSPPSPSIGIKYGMGTGMSAAMFPSLDFPTSHTGLPNQCLLPSSAASRMPLNFTCPVVLCPTSLESHGSKSASQGSQSSTRVLPSKIVQPHHSKEVMDYGCSHSGSTGEWSSSSTAKWKDPLFLTGTSLLEDDDDDEGGRSKCSVDHRHSQGLPC